MSGILESKCFWATDIRHMNDPTEQHYAWDVTLDALACCSDFLSRELSHILSLEGGIPGFEKEVFRYAACFCSQKDLASQWREYTPKENAVSLAIPFSALRKKAEAAEFALIRVVYDVDCQTLAIRSFIDNALNCWQAVQPNTKAEQDQFLGYVGGQLIQLMFRFKNPEYRREHEWRVLLIANKDEHPSVLRHRHRDGKHVPYIEFPFPLEYLDEAMIGPYPYGADEIRLRKILTDSRTEGVQVSRSSLNSIY